MCVCVCVCACVCVSVCVCRFGGVVHECVKGRGATSHAIHTLPSITWTKGDCQVG